MSQLNTLNVASPNNYVLGRGKLYFSLLEASLPTDWRDLGNCPNFTINSEEETVEHKSSREGLAVVDKKLTLSRTTNVSFDLDELTFDNLAKWFSGDAASDSYTLATGAGFDGIIVGANDWAAYKWYEIFDASGNRVYGLESPGINYTIIRNDDGPSFETLIETTHYLIDEAAGMIRFLPAAATVNIGGETAVDYECRVAASSSNNISIDQVNAFSQGSITGAIKFVAINPANNDEVREFQFHQVTIASDGDLSLIGDEFSAMSFTGVVESNTAADPDSPFVTIRGIGRVFSA